MNPELQKLIDEKNNADPELSAVAYLRNLSDRLMHVPVMYGTDQYDSERLREIASKIEEAADKADVVLKNIGTATMSDVERWKQEGIKKGATHLIVVCDTFGMEDYPVYVMLGQDVTEMEMQYSKNMQKVMETIKL